MLHQLNYVYMNVNRILIIQDSPSINMMLKFRLEPEGFSVDTAEDGKEGIDKAKSGDYQLILLDYNLPDINGPEVCRVLKENENTKGIPIVFMSAEEENKIAEVTKEASAEGYVAMPFKEPEFLEKIRGFIGR